jgi:beta-glucosidase
VAPPGAGGRATADLLLGDANPSGRLAETLPLDHAHTPAFGSFPGEHGHVRYGEGLLIGYRWYDSRHLEVAYPFGHGLSYTTFDWSDVSVEVHDDGPDAAVDVSVTVRNSGSRRGHEVVQVYVADPESAVFRPVQELKGFAAVDLQPGESTRVTVALDSRAFAWWHVGLGRWVVEPGDVEIRVAASSRDVRHTAVVRLAGEPVVEPLSPEVPLAVWLDHPVAGPRLAHLMTRGGAYDEHRLRRMRENPVAHVARMPGFPVAADGLDRLAADLVAEPTPVGMGQRLDGDAKVEA